MDTKSLPSSRASCLRVRVALFLSLCLALGLTYKYWFGPPSPEQVRDQTIHALEVGDADTLCRLADPDEMQKLHLTAKDVNAALCETVWAQGHPRLKKYTVFASKPADRREWLIEWGGAPHLHPIGLTVLDDLHVGWRLNLSDLLRNAYYQDKSFAAAGAAYHSRFIGSRSDSGDYHFFDAQNK